MFQILIRAKNLYLRPTVGAQAIIAEGTLQQAWAIIVVTSIVNALGLGTAIALTDGHYNFLVWILVVTSVAISLALFWSFFMALCTLLEYGVAKIFDGTGTFKTLFIVSVYGCVVYAAGVLIQIMCSLAKAPEIFTDLLSWVLSIWSLVVTVITLREVMVFSTWRAIIVEFSTLAIIVLIVVAFVLFARYLGISSSTI